MAEIQDKMSGENMDLNKKYQIMRIARKYYQLNMGQSEIAKEEGISKSTVSRLLQKAIKLGYVKISIEYPLESCVDIENQVKEIFGLKDVFISPVLIDDPTVILQDTCHALADRLDDYINDEDIIAVSWGHTMKCLADYINTIHSKNIKVVQINGSLSKFSTDTGARKIVDALASASYQGEGYMLPVPAIVDSKEIAEMLSGDSQVMNILNMSRKAKTAIFSIGAITPESVLCETNFLERSYFDKLREKGAVGDIASRFFDINGNIADPVLNERIVALDLQELSEKEQRIAIAVGMDKVKSILGALNGGYLNILYTDEKTARAILQEYYATQNKE